MNYKLAILDQALETEYTKFVLSMPNAMMYHALPYRELIKKLLGAGEQYMVAADENGKIAGVLPLLYKEGPLGRVYNSLPFYGSNGGVLTDTPEVFTFLLNAYNSFVSDNEIASSTLISNPLSPADDYNAVIKNHADYRIGQFSPIAFTEAHEDKLMEMYHYKTRNMVRKAMKEGISIEVDNSQFGFLYDIHKHNMASIGGKAKPVEYFDLIQSHYKPGVDYKIYVAKYNGEIVAALLLYYFNRTVEYYTPVIVEKFREKQPLSLIIYQAMTDASKNGFTKWNWGGTWASQGGVYTFKKRWGTYDINYDYHIFLKNQQILKSKKEDLLKHYDGFFVITFDKLIAS